MKVQWRVELPQLALIAGMFLIAAVSWSRVPDTVPTHWNIYGEVDDYGGKFIGLLLLPLVALALYLFTFITFYMLSMIMPGVLDGTLSGRILGAFRIAHMFLLSMVYVAMAMAAWGRPVNVSTASMIGMGVLVMVVGNFLGKIRPNWCVGVITPWTLASRESWNKTHRLSGWLSVAIGLLIAATGVIWTTWMLAILILACLASVITVIAYSYLVYRDDLHPVSPPWPFPGAETRGSTGSL
jgi:uncharacterized membrane protein